MLQYKHDYKVVNIRSGRLQAVMFPLHDSDADRLSSVSVNGYLAAPPHGEWTLELLYKVARDFPGETAATPITTR